MNVRVLSLIVISAFLTFVTLKGQESDAVTNSPASNNGFFAYADYYNYIGAGSMGELVNAEASYLQLFYIMAQTKDVMYTDSADGLFDTYVPKKPKGDISGGTVGYTWNSGSNDRLYLQLGYRAGTQNSLLGYSRMKATMTGVLHEDLVEGRIRALTYYDDYKYYFKYRQDTCEYRLSFSYSPQSINYLTLGLEYVYGDYKGRITHYIDGHKSYVKLYGTGSYWYDLDNDGEYDKGKEEVFGSASAADYDKSPRYFYGFSQKSHDFLLHATLKTPVYRLFSTSCGDLMALPRIDVGLGYSFRKGKINPGHWYKTPSETETVLTDNAKPILSKDHVVFESTATLGFYYAMGSTFLTLDGGYRYKTDVSNENYGCEVKGFYARLGLNHTW